MCASGFVAVEVGSGLASLHRLVDAVDKCMAEFSQPIFYHVRCHEWGLMRHRSRIDGSTRPSCRGRARETWRARHFRSRCAVPSIDVPLSTAERTGSDPAHARLDRDCDTCGVQGGEQGITSSAIAACDARRCSSSSSANSADPRCCCVHFGTCSAGIQSTTVMRPLSCRSSRPIPLMFRTVIDCSSSGSILRA